MSERIQILLVEDDMAQRLLLTAWLKGAGYHVDAFDNGIDARNFLMEGWADLIILDWDIPGMAGDKLLSLVRGRSRSNVPVLFQTIHSAEEDIVRILDLGADDFLVKPFDRAVLLARIRTLLRRFQVTSVHARTRVLGRCVLDQSNLVITCDEHEIRLGNKEFAILWHMASVPGTLVPRQKLQMAVWGLNAEIETRLVDMYVSRLRSKLKPICSLGWEIQSVYGQGYRLNLQSSAGGCADTILNNMEK
ncbi:MAG: response regulator transcription factor [Pseudomonadota bacterium]